MFQIQGNIQKSQRYYFGKMNGQHIIMVLTSAPPLPHKKHHTKYPFLCPTKDHIPMGGGTCGFLAHQLKMIMQDHVEQENICIHTYIHTPAI